MSKRRAHRKSRGGCAQCKRRHIKCDEERPACSHCVRYQMPCEYRPGSKAGSDVVPTAHRIPPVDAKQVPGSLPCAHESPPLVRIESGSLFQMKDMALLHHWVTAAGPSVLNTQDFDHYWHSVIPSIGFKHPYVMHSILSLAALHMAHTNPTDKDNLLHIAADHQSQALDIYTKELNDVGSHNSSALFVNAALTFFYAFISFSSAMDSNDIDTNARTARVLGAEWIPLVRGTSAVLKPIYHHVWEGPLCALLDLRHFDEFDQTKSTDLSCYDKQLLGIQDLWATDDHASTYDDTMRGLLRCSAWMELSSGREDIADASWGYNRVCNGPFIWLFRTDEKYFVLQKQRQPCAMIIFAYYGVLLHRLDSYWWSQSCGRSIVDAVDICLGPYWKPWLDWPKRMVGL